MIKDKKLLEKFNKDENRNKKYSYKDCVRIFEALWQEAMDLGIVPSKDALEDIEDEIRIAKAINHRI